MRRRLAAGATLLAALAGSQWIAGPDCAAAARQAPPPRLRIVVLAGEDAVNIIQQNTAVAPIVQVVDQNDQPVAGATVRFAVNQGRATFGGARTLTVTTNAAGRATATGLTPTSPGRLEIQATASFRGLTATATISQTNALTITAAAGAGAGAGAGAATAAAGGAAAAGAAAGGLGAGTIAAIAGGIGGGALVAARATGIVGGQADCGYTVTPTSIAAPSAGGTFPITVDRHTNDCEPKDAAPNATIEWPFLGITGGAIAPSTIMPLYVQGNAPGNPVRTGTVTIEGHVVTVTQAAACAFTVSPTSVTFPKAGGSVVLTVSATPAGCDTPQWTAETISNRITLSPASGSGNGAVTATMLPYPFIGISLPPLTGNILVANIIVPFVQ